MSKTKIGAGVMETTEAAQPDPETLAGLSGEGTTAVVRHEARMDGTMACGGGGTGISIKPSFLQIAYGVGKMAQKGFTNSALVLDGEFEIARMNQNVTVVIAGARKYWKQWMGNEDYAAKKRAREYDTLADAVRAGEVTEWGPRGSNAPKPTVSEALDLTLLVKRPDGCQCPAFVLRLGDDWYAPARFTADKALYGDINRMVSNAMLIDAGERRVAPGQGRLDGYFMTLSTYIVVDQAQNKTRTHVALNFLLDANKAKVPVPAGVKSDLASLTEQLREAGAQPVAADDEGIIPAANAIPPVATDIQM